MGQKIDRFSYFSLDSVETTFIRVSETYKQAGLNNSKQN
jgi:hypothetical protein